MITNTFKVWEKSMAKYPLQHCDIDDVDCCPTCQEKNNGVYYLRVEGSRYCGRHGANKEIEAARKASANQYRVQVWQQRMTEFTENDQVKSLRAEIGILRLLIETILNRCSNSEELLLYSNKISDLTMKLEKIVTACDKLDRSMGLMLDKGTALKLASDIVTLISEHVNDPEVVDAISNGIIDLLGDI